MIGPQVASGYMNSRSHTLSRVTGDCLIVSAIITTAPPRASTPMTVIGNRRRAKMAGYVPVADARRDETVGYQHTEREDDDEGEKNPEVG